MRVRCSLYILRIFTAYSNALGTNFVASDMQCETRESQYFQYNNNAMNLKTIFISGT